MYRKKAECCKELHSAEHEEIYCFSATRAINSACSNYKDARSNAPRKRWCLTNRVVTPAIRTQWTKRQFCVQSLSATASPKRKRMFWRRISSRQITGID